VDKLGTPQYGGEFTIRLNRKIVNFDPWYGVHLTQIHTAWLEKMFVDDWTMDPAVYDYRIGQRPIAASKATWPKAGNLLTRILLWFISVKESIGKICRRLTVANLSPMISSFIFTDVRPRQRLQQTQPRPRRRGRF